MALIAFFHWMQNSVQYPSEQVVHEPFAFLARAESSQITAGKVILETIPVLTRRVNQRGNNSLKHRLYDRSNLTQRDHDLSQNFLATHR